MAHNYLPASLALVLAASMLASCASPNADRALAAQRDLVGMPVQTLLSCAGVPQRSATVDNTEFLTYTSTRVGYGGPTTSVGVAGGSGGAGVGVGFGIPLGTWGSSGSSCEATFTVRNGVVQQITYTGTAGTQAALSQCYRIVENCMAFIPQQRAPATQQRTP